MLLPIVIAGGKAQGELGIAGFIGNGHLPRMAGLNPLIVLAQDFASGADGLGTSFRDPREFGAFVVD